MLLGWSGLIPLGDLPSPDTKYIHGCLERARLQCMRENSNFRVAVESKWLFSAAKRRKNAPTACPEPSKGSVHFLGSAVLKGRGFSRSVRFISDPLRIRSTSYQICVISKLLHIKSASYQICFISDPLRIRSASYQGMALAIPSHGELIGALAPAEISVTQPDASIPSHSSPCSTRQEPSARGICFSTFPTIPL